MFETTAALNNIVDLSLKFCRECLADDGMGGLRLVDPIDQKTVEAHYGDSHLAAALILLGKKRADEYLVSIGIQLTETIIRDWKSSEKIEDFHHDFNNFALCLVEEKLRSTNPEISQKIRELVVSTKDSRHNTINWLPMRAFVNRSRYKWTGQKQYEQNAHRCIRSIMEATNDDGGIEDRLPKGSSYNLQYNVSSFAALLYLTDKWDVLDYDFERGHSFLRGHVLPDSDLNYMGRGTNQIFAWGPWLYTLSRTGSKVELLRALEFLKPRYPLAVKNRNIFLNDFPGPEKLFWWDYHYCSVYHAHFLLWSTLALEELDAGKKGDPTMPRNSQDSVSSRETSTGLSIKRGEFGGAVVFEGRSIYLAESGPNLCSLWDSAGNVLFKGGLGPWQGAFGTRHAYADSVFLNHFGLISQKSPGSFLDNQLAKKLNWKYAENREAIVKPEFGDIEIEFDDAFARVVVTTDEVFGYFNTPLFDGTSSGHRVMFQVDGREVQSILVGKFKNQYGWANAIRSKPGRGKRWEAIITRHETLE